MLCFSKEHGTASSRVFAAIVLATIVRTVVAEQLRKLVLRIGAKLLEVREKG